MSMRRFSLILACLAGTTCLLAQASAPAPPADAASRRADAYAEFLVGHHDAMLAETEGAPYIDEALQHFQAALQDDPGNTFVPLQMSELLFRVGRSSEAIKLAQSIATAHPDSIPAHELLGEIYTQLVGSPDAGAGSSPLTEAITEYQTLIRLQPNNADNYITLGRLFHMQGHNDLAEQQMRAALAIDSGSEVATGNLVLLLSADGQLDAAIAAVNAAPASARSPRLYAALAQGLDAHGRYADAAAAWRKAVALSPDDTDLQQGLAQALIDSGDLAGAQSVLKQLTTADATDGTDFLRLAQVEQQQGDLSAADRDMQTAERLLPDQPEVRYDSALLSEAEGHNDQAIATLEAAAQATARPDNDYGSDAAQDRALILDHLASLQLKTHDDAGALATYRAMEALGGDYQDHARLAEIPAYEATHQYTQAAADAQTELKAHPDSRELRLETAGLQAEAGQTDDALATLAPLTVNQPSSWDAWLARAEAEQDGHRWAAAEADARQAGQLAGNNASRAQAQNVLGSIEQSEKHFDQAEASYKQALVLDPGNPDVLNNLGYMLADRGRDLPAAVTYLQQAIAREPDNGAFLDSLGLAYLKMKRLDEARTQLERAADLQPDDPTVLDHLAQAYYSSGQYQQAAASWQQSLTNWSSVAPAAQDPAAEQEVRKRLEAVQRRLAHH